MKKIGMILAIASSLALTACEINTSSTAVTPKLPSAAPSTTPSAQPAPSAAPTAAPASPTPAASASTSTSTDLNFPAEYYPIAAGKKWTYLITTALKNMPAGFDIPTPSITMIQEILTADDSGYRIRITTNPPGTSTEIDIKKGADGKYGSSTSADYSGPPVAIDLTQTPESVTVPAGTFSAIKLTATVTGGTNTTWYAKGVGMIKQITDSSQSTSTLTLQSYQ